MTSGTAGSIATNEVLWHCFMCQLADVATQSVWAGECTVWLCRECFVICAKSSLETLPG